MSAPKPPKKFDPAKFSVMVEPLSIRVERRHAGASMPIELPPEEDQALGSFSKDRIRGIEAWLVNEWTGGGTYYFQLSDSSEPPQSMEWFSVYPTTTFPMRTPPSVADFMRSQAPPPPPPPLPPASQPLSAASTLTQPSPLTPSAQVNMSTQWPTQQPQFAPVGAVPVSTPGPQVIYQQPPYYQQTTMLPTRSSYGTNYAGEGEREREKRELEARLAAAEQARIAADQARLAAEHRTEQARLAAEHKAEVDRLTRENEARFEQFKATVTPRTDPSIDARFAKLDSVLEKIVDRITQPAGPSPEVLAMKEEARELRMKLEREAERREADQREAARREAERRDAERSTAPSPELVAMREMLARQEQEMRAIREKAERDAERRDAERREDSLRESMRQQNEAMQAALRQQAEATKAQIEVITRSLEERSNRSDPMIELLKDQQRQAQDNLRAIQDASRSAAAEVRSMMMGPEQVIGLINKSNSGIDDVRRTMTGAMSDLFGMTRQAIEQIGSLQPQGESPAVRIIGEAVNGLSDAAKRYMTAKAQTGIAEQTTQQEYIKAQVQMAQTPPPIAQAPIVVNPQLMQQAAQQLAQPAPMQQPPMQPMMAQPAPAMPMQQSVMQPAMPQQAQAAQPQGGLNGAEGAPQAAQTPLVTIAAQGVVTSPKRADEQWFGPALPQVVELRQRVQLYLHSIQQGEAGIDAKTGRPMGLDPVETAGALLLAIGQIQAMNLKISAFEDLLKQARYADFMDALLPAPVPQAYRDDAMNLLLFALQGGDLATVPHPTVGAAAGANSGADPDDGEDDEDEDGDDAADAPVHAPGSNGVTPQSISSLIRA